MGMIGNPADNSLRKVANDSYNGDGSTTVFTLSAAVNSATDIEVLVDNVQQSPYDASYTASGTTLTFSEAPASGTNNIYVIYHVGRTSVVGEAIPQDGSVTPTKLDRSYIPGTSVEGAMTTQFGRRNIIINGDMTICQRGGEGSSATFGSTNTYHIDRWLGREDTDGALSSTHSTEAPAGFRYSQKVTVSTADASLGAAQKAYFSQRIEGTNFAQFAFGTAGAKAVSLSFYVRSSVTGTFSGSLTNQANNRAYVFEYTINSADTWERKEVTITGDTSGTWATSSSTWAELYFDLGVGSNFEGTAGSWVAAQDFGSSGSIKLINTLNATWYITGVQLEVGTVATPFEYRSYGEELTLCQRYFHRSARGTIIGAYINSDRVDATIHFPTTMRATPTMTASSGTNYWYAYTGTIDYFNAWSGAGGASVNNGSMYVSSGEISGPDNAGCQISFSTNDSYFQADAEL